MKHLKTILIALLLAGLTACTSPETISCPAEEPTGTDLSAADTDLSPDDETDPADTDTDLPHTDPPETEASEDPEEITIVLGEDVPDETEPPETLPEKPDEDTDETVIRMLVPAEYEQVRDALTKSRWYGLSYQDAITAGITETMAPQIEADVMEAVPEAVMDAPAADFSYNASADAPGKVYTEAEMYSKTNTQLQEIDEGDIVKTDGEYIYILKDTSELVILAADGKDTRILSRTALTEDLEICGVAPADGGKSRNISIDQEALELYIHEDRAAVIYRENTWDSGSRIYKTCADIYDVSDPAVPIYVTTLGQDGIYSASRMIDGTVWLITRHGLSIDDIAEPLDYESYIPGFFDKNTQTLADPGSIVYPEQITDNVYTVISSCELKSGVRGSTKAVLGIAPDILYMNSRSIYLADAVYFNEKSEPRTEGVYTVVDHTSGTRTKLMRLDITDGIRTAAYGEIPGQLPNQFAMDEYDGHLRLVTTVSESSRTTFTDESWGFVNTRYNLDNRANALYILDRDLNITGMIGDIAPDENVKSVRFMGNTGYFVTFRQVDPLFTVDLSNPESPEILSELKIPGFSQYLHPWDDGLLLGLGQDADENGRTDGMKLSMFDVSDPCDVTEGNKLKLVYRYSEALNNHRAVLASASRNLIGFPADGGYAVYGYDWGSGFFERAYIEIEGKWSGNSRGLFVDDGLYIVMQSGCTVLDLMDFTVLTSVNY